MQMLLKAAKFQYVETFDPVGKDNEDDQYLFVLRKQDSECCEVGAERELVGMV